MLPDMMLERAKTTNAALSVIFLYKWRLLMKLEVSIMDSIYRIDSVYVLWHFFYLSFWTKKLKTLKYHAAIYIKFTLILH